MAPFHKAAPIPAARARSVRRRACYALGLLATLLCASPVAPQAPPLRQTVPDEQPHVRPRRALPQDVLPEDSSDVISVDTNLVPVDVTVTNAAGQPVRDLRSEDFKLYEDDVERPISFFNVEQRSGARRPVAVVFAVDISGSVSPEEMERIGQAAQAFSRRLYDRDSVFAVMSFGMRVNVLQNFTNDPAKLERALHKLAREQNGLSTHTYDAVDDAVRLLARSAPRTRERKLLKRAVVVITDGFPVGDTVAPETVIERANVENVSVYTVTLPSFSRLLTTQASAHAPLPTPLDVSGIAERTGGSNVYADQKDFESLFKSLADEVVSTYVLAFYPPEENRRDGRFHRVRVSAPAGLTVRQSRPGYRQGG